MIRNIVIAILSLTILSFIGCKETSKSEYIIIDESKNGQTIDIAVGKYLIVKIGGNPTTGFIWEQKGECKVLETYKDPEFEPKSKELVGSPGTKTFFYKVISAGTDSLVLINHRPWEKDKEPTKRFSITINAR